MSQMPLAKYENLDSLWNVYDMDKFVELKYSTQIFIKLE